jgi:hypothetical protein
MNDTKKIPLRITRAQFYKVCRALEERRGDLQDLKPGGKEAASIISKMVGFEVSISSIEKAKKATGVKWSTPFTKTKTRASISGHIYRRVTRIEQLLEEIIKEIGIVYLLEKYPAIRKD